MGSVLSGSIVLKPHWKNKRFATSPRPKLPWFHLPRFGRNAAGRGRVDEIFDIVRLFCRFLDIELEYKVEGKDPVKKLYLLDA